LLDRTVNAPLSRRLSQRRAEIARRDDLQPLEPEPLLHQAQFGDQRFCGFIGGARLGIGGEQPEHASRPVCPQIGTRHYFLAEQKWHYIVTVPALLGRGIDLDAVAEIEQALGARALEHERVERGEQRPSLDLARLARSGMEKGLLLPAFDIDRQQVAGLDQLLEPALHGGGRQPEIVAEISRRGDAQSGRRNPQQLAVRFGTLGRRHGKNVFRQHALG